MEDGALVGGAGGPDAAAVLGDDAATDGEAKAGAAHSARVGGVALLEAIEDVLQLTGRDAASLITHFDDGFVVVEIARGEMNLAAWRGELDRVREKVVEGLKDAVGVGPNVDAVRGEEDADVGFGRASLLHACGAAQQVFGAAHGGVQLSLAARNSLEVEDVVDQADEAIGVADGDIEHLLCLLGAAGESAAGEQAEGSTQGGERGAELMRNGGDELVLHAIEGAALGGVGEGDDGADGPLAFGVVRMGVDLGARYVLDREAGAVLAPVDLVGDAHGLQIGEAVVDGAVFERVGRAIGAGVVDEFMDVAAKHLALFVAEHLCCGCVDHGDPAFEVDAVDAITDGLQNGVGLSGEGAEAAFGADLLADVDAEAEDIGGAAGDADELVAVGDDANLAVGVREMEEALGLAGLADFFEVGGQGGLAVRHDELGEVMAAHVFDHSADGLGAVGVDGEQRAAEVVGADHAEGAFDELAVASFTFAERGLGGALGGDVDAGGDDEGDLTLRVGQGGSRPGDAAKTAVAVEPLIFECGGEFAGTEALEGFDGLGNFVAGDELVPGVAADQGGEVVAGGGLAGAVEADDAAGSVEDGDQRAYGVEHS